MPINIKNLKVRTNIPEGYEIVLPEEALKVFLHYLYDDVKRILKKSEKGGDAMRDNGTVGEVGLDPCYTAKDIAKAAGVRKSLIMKYIREGVRGVGLLRFKGMVNGEPLIPRSELERFANHHTGRARDIAVLALENLKE